MRCGLRGLRTETGKPGSCVWWPNNLMLYLQRLNRMRLKKTVKKLGLRWNIKCGTRCQNRLR